MLDREKEVVRLGSGSGDMKRLAPDAIERGVAALRSFRRIADAHGAEVHAVATSAVREAENRDEFLRRARDEAGVEVEVITGLEEARLIHLGVLQAVPVFDAAHPGRWTSVAARPSSSSGAAARSSTPAASSSAPSG